MMSRQQGDSDIGGLFVLGLCVAAFIWGMVAGKMVANVMCGAEPTPVVAIATPTAVPLPLCIEPPPPACPAVAYTYCLTIERIEGLRCVAPQVVGWRDTADGREAWCAEKKE